MSDELRASSDCCIRGIIRRREIIAVDGFPNSSPFCFELREERVIFSNLSEIEGFAALSAGCPQALQKSQVVCVRSHGMFT